jgi:hypothetical protein
VKHFKQSEICPNKTFKKMTIDQFIHVYNIKPADAIVVKKEKFGILDHYVIYLGQDSYGEHKFIANYTKGIQFIEHCELVAFLQTYVPVRLNRFIGNEAQRIEAVRRALTRLNERAYNLILNNCEHFANWVQKGLPKSEQVEDVGKALALTGAGVGLVGLAAKNERVATFGLLTAALGLITLRLSDQR